MIENLLGAPDREGRNDHVATAVAGFGDDRDHLVEGRGLVAVGPVAIGGFHHQDVGVRNRRRIMQDGAPGLAKVAGKDQLHGLTSLCDPDLDDRRSEDVAGVAEDADDIGM